MMHTQTQLGLVGWPINMLLTHYRPPLHAVPCILIMVVQLDGTSVCVGAGAGARACVHHTYLNVRCALCVRCSMHVH